MSLTVTVCQSRDDGTQLSPAGGGGGGCAQCPDQEAGEVGHSGRSRGPASLSALPSLPAGTARLCYEVRQSEGQTHFH